MNDLGARFRRLMLILGDPSRYALTRALDTGGKCVTDLAIEVGLSQSCTTRHLQALEREQVVRGRRAGKRVIYDLCRDDPLVMELLAFGGRPATNPHHTVFLYADIASATDGPPAPARDPSKEDGRPTGRPGAIAAASSDENATPSDEPRAPAAHRSSDIEDYLL